MYPHVPTRTAAIVVIVAGSPLQAPTFSFAGVGLRSDIREVASRYPHSSPDNGYLILSPQDVHDHISEIGLTGEGPTRRVRVGFETRPDGRHLDYPPCAAIEAKLVSRFGRPNAVRRFDEEATVRVDRVWQSPAEEMMLMCFVGPRRREVAEAVVITPR